MKIKENIKLLEKFVDIYHRYDKNPILTGSLALILLGKMDERKCGDIDIVIPYMINMEDVGTVYGIKNEYTTADMEVHMPDGLKMHVIVDPKCHYSFQSVPHDWKHKNPLITNIKVSNVADILTQKFKSYAYFGSTKNRNDIFEMLKKEIEKENKDNEIPPIQ